MHVSAIGNSIDDGTPRLPQIGRLKDVRLEIVELVSIDRRISGLAIMRRCFDQIDRAPFRHFRADVVPMRAVISRGLNDSVVRPGPQCSFVHRRLG